jgi:hypothetical protein
MRMLSFKCVTMSAVIDVGSSVDEWSHPKIGMRSVSVESVTPTAGDNHCRVIGRLIDAKQKLLDIESNGYVITGFRVEEHLS